MDTAPHTGLAGLTWPQVDARRDALLVVPLGATEQHGPHLPLSTDTDIATELGARLATARASVLLAPALAYGSSGEHQHFAGTLSIGADALRTLLVELGRSASATFRRLLFLSCHGGNAEPVAAAAARLRYEGRDVRVFTPRWPDGDAHAGRTETAVQLAANPGLVHPALAAAGATEPLSVLLPALRDGGVIAVSANGVLGDPAGASAAEGERLLAAVAADLVSFVDDWTGGG